ncbi:hypothetical protein H2201_002153 [Coniosporium apollinis]|uniref:ATP-dependent RNA helicase n=1 Tax=Coniosporium apollinis TaxID=61459 RepID=A0ABQ9P037_9PEZI|nr:hypothetical protein H2201_002153 [Coniosporium apollinis]
MLGALRRSTASLPRTLPTSTLSLSTSARVFQSSVARSPCRQSILRLPAANRAFHQTVQWQQHAVPAAERAVVEAEVEQEVGAERPSSDIEIAALGPVTKFHELETRGLVHPNVVRTITKEMRLETMTEVQSRTINEGLKGVDVIAQAKTGTGKTMAFLLPVLQRIINDDPSLAERGFTGRRNRPSAADTRALIISPTRELAEQIAAEARRLTRNTGVVVQTAVGGTQKNMGLRMMQNQGVHLLIGTPGRLKDILSDEYSGVQAPKLSAMVLDEADRLLDDGFWPEIKEIQRYLPDQKERERQTLMFSATIPREVVQLVRQTLKPGFHFVKCVRDDEEPTHTRVPQKLVLTGGLENRFPTLYELMKREVEAAAKPGARPFKAIVYFNSTADVELAHSVFRSLQGSARRGPLYPAQIFEIHGKLSQQQRTRSSDRFREATSGILLSSDVTARGMDFPNVTHVIQVGLPTSRDTYVHRIGRTARAGKEGEGWLILSEIDRRELRSRLRDLPLNEDTSLQAAKVDMTEEGQIPESVAQILEDVGNAFRDADPAELANAYRSYIGTYGWYPDKQRMVDAINDLAKFGWGLERTPKLSSGTAHKLGLSRVRGLNLGSDPAGDYGDRDRSSDLSGRSSRFDRGDRGSGSGGRSFDRGSSGGGRSFDRGSGDSGRPFDRGSGGRDRFSKPAGHSRGNVRGGFSRDRSEGSFGRGGDRGGYSGRLSEY